MYIHTYKRHEAIRDGVLIDATTMAEQAGFKIPVAMTSAVFEDCVAWTLFDDAKKPCGQCEKGRLWDVLYSAFLKARRTDGDRCTFRLGRVSRTGPQMLASIVDLVLVIHPGDDGEPVCTIMMTDEN